MKGKKRTTICQACRIVFAASHPTGVFPRHCAPCRAERRTAKIKANNKVSKEVLYGRLKPATAFLCVDCHGPGAVWDHRDYSRPLEVEAVCKRCNALRGSAKWGGGIFLPSRFNLAPSPTQISDAPDCAAITLMGAA
jgi:hypothetical protein